MKILEGKNVLIVGVANKHSIAAGIAESMSENGANVALTYQNDRLRGNVEKLGQEWGVKTYLPCDVSSDNEIKQTFSNLCKKANIVEPKLFIYNADEPNAFATGRNQSNSVVALSSGLIHILDLEEIEGVMAHELAHIENRDILIGSIAATFAGAISMIASMIKWGLIFGAFRGNRNSGGLIGNLLIAILAPLIALIIQMAISRTREYKADSTAAQITDKPKFLASALTKIQKYHLDFRQQKESNKELQTATSHMFIISPISGGVGRLFSSHPPTEERVKRLLNM